MCIMEVKGTTWVGNVYQKIEAMCLEVEEVVCEDTVKYVENQVQTVGASVKKFYSDVIQDLLPPSFMEPAGVPSDDLSLNQHGDFGINRKPETSIKVSLCREISDTHELCDQIDSTSRPYSVEDTGGDLRGRENFFNNTIRSTSVNASNVIPTSDMILPVEPCVTKETELKSTSSTGGPCGFSADSTGIRTNSGGIFPIESHAGRDMQDNASANVDEGSSCTVEWGLSTIEQFEHSKLEETCILVDGDELHFTSNLDDKSRSYKKKIRKGFASKSSSRKHEYELLAVQYENMKVGSNYDGDVESMMPTFAVEAHDFCDSEWELL